MLLGELLTTVLKFLLYFLCRIAGWNYRCQSHLNGMFHIGDQLVAINDQPVVCAENANSILKTCYQKVDAQLLVKRLPHAVVILMNREGLRMDHVGIETNNGTAEVSGTINIQYLLTNCTLRNLFNGVFTSRKQVYLVKSDCLYRSMLVTAADLRLQKCS